jgi:Protein of unknown function (DUF2802)
MPYEPGELIFLTTRVALLAVTLLCFALAFASWRKSSHREIQTVLAETRALSEWTERLATRVTALQQRFEDERELAAAAAGASQRSYQLALQMARNGLAPQEIASASGVSRHEAQLLAQLHGPAREPA